MNDIATALVAILIFGASALLYLRQRSGGVDDRWLPPELQGAMLAYAERTFRSYRRGLVARLDRAYCKDGELTLVELKTRDRNTVYMSDVIELSVQRIAIQDEVGEPVSMDAYVAVQTGGRGPRTPIRVRLLGIAEIAALNDRYREILKGNVSGPRPAKGATACARCAHFGTCSTTFGDRGV